MVGDGELTEMVGKLVEFTELVVELSILGIVVDFSETAIEVLVDCVKSKLVELNVV